jgi:hypothetical protein
MTKRCIEITGQEVRAASALKDRLECWPVLMTVGECGPVVYSLDVGDPWFSYVVLPQPSSPPYRFVDSELWFSWNPEKPVK